MCVKTICDIVIDRDNVLWLLISLDANKSHGWDEISGHMVKAYGGSSLIEPLCHIFERFLAAGIYTSTWKKANIVPIH